MLSIAQIQQSIDDHSPKRHSIRATTRQAAVSVVLRTVEQHTEALFILRATQDGDPWSGHMAFPGGHLEDDDESLRHAAERETLEEIGLDLVKTSSFIGQIDPVAANPRGRDLDMVVTPFVYELKESDATFTPNYEVADVLWGSLNDMHSGSSHTQGEFKVQGQTVSYPGYGVGDEIVWGLTYRMLDLFFAVLDPHWVER
jgi:8-oxo-dGTP pyrophosphatase MutT (NUDIX family)